MIELNDVAVFIISFSLPYFFQEEHKQKLVIQVIEKNRENIEAGRLNKNTKQKQIKGFVSFYITGVVAERVGTS